MTTRFSPKKNLQRRRLLKEGTYGNPHPLKDDMSLDDSYMISHRQRRYHGTTMVIAHRKGKEPSEYRCPMRGHRKQLSSESFSKESFEYYQETASPTRRDGEWHTNPIKNENYEQFIENYVLFEHYDAYTD